MPKLFNRSILALLIIAGSLSFYSFNIGPGDPKLLEVVPDADNAGLKLPAGFAALFTK